MAKYHVQIEDDKGQHLDVHEVNGPYQDVENFINATDWGHIFKVFEDTPLLFGKGDYVRYERNTTGLFDIRRVPFQK